MTNASCAAMFNLVLYEFCFPLSHFSSNGMAIVANFYSFFLVFSVKSNEIHNKKQQKTMPQGYK